MAHCEIILQAATSVCGSQLHMPTLILTVFVTGGTDQGLTLRILTFLLVLWQILIKLV